MFLVKITSAAFAYVIDFLCERRVKLVKDDCLSKLILFGERSLKRALCEYLLYYQAERSNQDKDNVLLYPYRRESNELH